MKPLVEKKFMGTKLDRTGEIHLYKMILCFLQMRLEDHDVNNFMEILAFP